MDLNCPRFPVLLSTDHDSKEARCAWTWDGWSEHFCAFSENLLIKINSCYFIVSTLLIPFFSQFISENPLPPPPNKQKEGEFLLLHLGMVPLELPVFPRRVEHEEKDCTRYLCLFIYSVNSSCAGALKRRRTFVCQDPSTLCAVFPRDLSSSKSKVCSFASVLGKMRRPE